MKTVSDSILCILHEEKKEGKIALRICGTNYILMEYIPTGLDLKRRIHLQWVETMLREMQPEGLLEITGGVCSLLISYNYEKISANQLAEQIKKAEEMAQTHEGEPLPSRLVNLPIAFHDSATKDCIERYMRGIRGEAPYLPDNMEFLAQCNHLPNAKAVEDIVLSTEYMVLGLGDVYMGAPCAVPLNEKARINAPKYNPARIYTPEGAVGIGGTFMAIYSTQSPGGYQLVGRTSPIWNPSQTGENFKEAPWLLRPFDRIQFYRVTEEKLEQIRTDVKAGRHRYSIQNDEFRMDGTMSSKQEAASGRKGLFARFFGKEKQV